MLLVGIALAALALVAAQWVSAQPSTPEDFVTYEKQSGFIKEFAVPFEEIGLKGIIAGDGEDIWFYHSTNTTSTLVLFEPATGEFTKFPVKGGTVTDEPIINLASSQLAFDSERNAVWFTDARINSIGRLDVDTEELSLWPVPTEEAGPMGIALSPDGNRVWFAEITGDKIASIDARSGEITEYPTGEESGPALLAFDDSRQLWVTLSFADSVLVAQPWALAPNSSLGMSRFSLPEPDRFSPLGIAFSGGKVFLPDHGSSRIIMADVESNLQDYDVYWTSPSQAFPTTLPSQIVSDRDGNIYFAQHGGNRISAITTGGVMTEYEIPTGPLSTVVYLSASEGRVWFAEWASNKIAYLDTTIPFPFTVNVNQNASVITLNRGSPGTIDVSLSSEEVTGPASLSEVEIGLAGMTESGPRDVTYQSQPPRVNLQDSASAKSEIQISVQESARPGSYTAMVRAFAPEQDGLVVSKLYPVEMVLDVPEPAINQGGNDFQMPGQPPDTAFQYALRIGAPLGAAGLIAFAVYRWRKNRRQTD